MEEPARRLHFRSDAEIEALVEAFEACTLPHAEWTHQEHLTVALCYLRRHGRAEATRRMRDNIRRYNFHHKGNTDGYHETITLAWLAVLAGRLAERDRGQALSELNQVVLEECGDKDYLLRYYTREVLLSAEARRAWMAPDVRAIE